MKVLSLIPPMTQLNTPYPSTAYLTGFLRSRGVDAQQADLALALVLQLMSHSGLIQLREAALAQPDIKQGGRVADIVIFERHAEQQQRLLTKRSRAKLLEHTK